MKYLKTRFICRLDSEGRFSAWKGSMLRGAMGTQLRRSLCMSRKEDCASCMLGPKCSFPLLFSPLSGSAKGCPPPFCLEDGLNRKSAYAPGELFEFDLLLFDHAVEYLPFYVHAFRMAGEKGLGSLNPPGRFTLEDLRCNGKSIYDREKDSLDMPEAVQLPLPVPLPVNSQCRLVLELLTPLRFKSGSQFSARLEFSTLFNLILRRISALKELENEKWRMDPEQFSFLRAEAEKVRMVKSDLVWHDYGRYSSRQDAAMKFGGLLGKISWQGPLAIFADFLNFAKIAHIGKQTSFGLGQLDFSLNDVHA